MVAAGDQSARLHLLRNLGRRGLRCSIDRLDALPSRVQLEHVAGAPCFLACALDTLITHVASKMPGHRLRELERRLDRDIRRVDMSQGCEVR